MLKQIRYLLLLFLCFTMNVAAQATTIGGLKYGLENGTATLLGTTADVPAVVTVPSSINYSGTSYPVKKIAVHAFDNVKTITSITFSEGIETFSEESIISCLLLTTVNLPASLKTWNATSISNCLRLANVNVTSGGQYFSSSNGVLYNADKTKLILWPRMKTTVSLPNTLKEIGDYALSYVGARTITIPNTVTTIGKGAFWSCSSIASITIPASTTSIGEGAFGNCTRLSTITVTAGNSAFVVENKVLYDSSKTTVLCIPRSYNTVLTLPSTVTTIAPKAAVSSSLTGITFSENLKKIGEEAFYGCTKIGALHFPATLTEIGTNAFSYAKPTAFTVAEGNPKFSALNDVLYNADKTKLILYPAGRGGAVPAFAPSMTSVAELAFSNTAATGELVLPAGVTEMGFSTFGNSNFTSIVLSEGLKVIPANAFSMCGNLQKVVIPSTVTSISTNVFNGSMALTEIECRAKVQPELQGTVSNVTIYVRQDANYNASQWGSSVTIKKELAVVPLTMTSHKYATFHWADKNYVLPIGLKGATLHLNGNKLEPRYDFAAGAVVAQNNALLLNGEAGAYDLVETKFAPASTVDVSGNLLFGRSAEERYTATKGHVFTLTTKNNVIGFYWQKGTNGTYANLKLHRGYIDVNAPAGVQGFNLDGDFITAIEGLEAETVAPQAPIYDLGGRAVQKPTRGLYIVNGKKVLF